nr:hypothetical protein [uncultured Glaciecola sp.]
MNIRKWNLVIGLALLTLSSLANANLIVNGNFDTAVPLNGTGAGWTAANNDSNGGWRNINGNGFFIINAAGQSSFDPSISQILNGLTIGQTYQISGDYTNYYNCCGNPLVLSFGLDITPGGLLIELSDPGYFPDWYAFSASFVATQSSHTVKFTAERNGDDTEYAIDNISVVTVPAPTAFILFGLSLVGLVFSNRKKA